MRRVIGLASIALFWEVSARLGKSVFFPPFTRVLWAMWKLFSSGEIFPHIATSLKHILLGFGIASSVGYVLGIIIYESKLMMHILMPIVDAVRPIAALTIFPLLILLFGLGLWSKTFCIFWTAWPAVLLNTLQGLRDVKQDILWAAQLDGANKWQTLYYISLPLSLDMTLTGMRIGLSGGWISLVSAEMLGSSSGLGYSILAYSQTFRFAEMYSIVIVIALLGLLMNIGMAYLQAVLSKRGKTGEKVSPFLRYHARASGFGLDSLRLEKVGVLAAISVRKLQSLRSRIRRRG